MILLLGSRSTQACGAREALPSSSTAPPPSTTKHQATSARSRRACSWSPQVQPFPSYNRTAGFSHSRCCFLCAGVLPPRPSDPATLKASNNHPSSFRTGWTDERVFLSQRLSPSQRALLCGPSAAPTCQESSRQLPVLAFAMQRPLGPAGEQCLVQGLGRPSGRSRTAAPPPGSTF